MSAAHRATFKPAIATSRAGGYQSTTHIGHDRDLPSHKQLKRRTDLNNQSIKQSNNQDDQIDSMKRALEAREKRIEHFDDSINPSDEQSESVPLPSDIDNEHKHDTDESQSVEQSVNETNQQSNDQSNQQSNDEDEDDEEEQIRRELEAIREERRIQREEEAAAALAANPLIASKTKAGGSKRKFDSGTIFKSSAPVDVDEQAPKRFLNDAVRSDQHRAFMKSYIR